MVQSHRFGAERRLRRRAEFQRVFETGRRVHGRFMTLVMAQNGVGHARLGIVASRKVGDAVRRNLAKRLIREVFRQSDLTASLDVVVIPRREFFDAEYPALDTDFRTAFNRGAQRIPQHERT